MGDNLNQLKHAAVKIIETFSKMKTNPLENFIFVEYNDPFVKNPIIIYDQSQLINILNNIIVYGGGDCAELGFTGIRKALEVVNEESYIFVFTDAPSKDTDQLNQIHKLIQKKRVKIFFITHLDCHTSSGDSNYKELAKFSDGFFFDVKSENVEQLVNQIPYFVENDRTTLEYFHVTANMGKTQYINSYIDSSMTNLMVSIAGNFSNLKVNDYNKSISHIFNSPSSSIYYMKNPTPGKISLSFIPLSDVIGQITTDSELTVDYGFSLSPVDSIDKTTTIPIANNANYLTIQVNKPELISILINFQYIDQNGSPIGHDALQKIGYNLYRSINFKFFNGNELFKIQLYGTDKNYNIIMRYISPMISPTTQKSPEVDAIVSKIIVNEGENINLVCKVISSLPIQFQWRTESSKILEQTQTSQSNTFRYTIKSAKMIDKGIYKCVAESKAGIGTSYIEVVVNPAPQYVAITNKNVKFRENLQKVTLNCEPQTNYPTKITWFYNNAPFLPKNVIRLEKSLQFNQISQNQNGEYKCVGEVNGHSNSDFVNVRVLTKPKNIQIYSTELNSQSKEVNTKLNHLQKYSFKDLIFYKLKCTATSDEIDITYKWYLNNELIHNKFEYILQYPSEIDSGIYSCEAINSNGETRNDIEIEFTTTLNFALKNLDKKIIEVELNGYMELKCSSNSNIKTSWSKLINNETAIKYIKSSPEFGLIGKENEKLICSFTEKNIKKGILFDVKVQTKPTVDTKLSKIPKYQDDLMELVCIGYGEPLPIIKWFKNDFEIQNGTNDFIITTNKLIKKNFKITDNGKFMCSAENKNGNTKTYFKPIIVKASFVWSNWNEWTECSTTCGYGLKYRKRVCIDNIKNITVDKGCVGPNIESDKCIKKECPIDGVLTNWTEFSTCSKSCIQENSVEISSKTRKRDCIPPKYGGKQCIGNLIETIKCNVPICPVNGKFSEWSEYGPCSVTCGEGKKIRTRTCIPPKYGGLPCDGNLIDYTSCNLRVCCNLTVFTYNEKRNVCEDINECKKLRNTCHFHTQTCVNTYGGYYCECRPGLSVMNDEGLIDYKHPCGGNVCDKVKCGLNEVCAPDTQMSKGYRCICKPYHVKNEQNECVMKNN